MKTYGWHEIGSVPASPGVYAWYYIPEITHFDLREMKSEVETLKSQGKTDQAKASLRQFLDRMIFRYFREQPYETRLKGALKPRYEGMIAHVPMLSESLIERLVENPARLDTIRDVLQASAPGFSSPLYIGMSERLKFRLSRHKSLIERYSEIPVGDDDSQEGRDHSFAREIHSRSIPPTRLFVVVNVIDDTHGTYVDIENILNRIHYPLLGRN